MATKLALLGLVTLLFCMPKEQPDGARHGTERIVYRTTIADDNEVVVLVGPRCHPDLVRGLVKSPLSDQLTGAYPIRIELHAANQPPLLIASRLRVEARDPETGIEVLDLLAEPGRVVVAIAQGPALVLWLAGVGPVEASGWCVLHQHEWAVAAPLEPISSDKVRVKLGRNQHGVATIEVSDLRASAPKVTKFRQVDGQWAFEPVDR